MHYIFEGYVVFEEMLGALFVVIFVWFIDLGTHLEVLIAYS